MEAEEEKEGEEEEELWEGEGEEDKEKGGKWIPLKSLTSTTEEIEFQEETSNERKNLIEKVNKRQIQMFSLRLERIFF